MLVTIEMDRDRKRLAKTAGHRKLNSIRTERASSATGVFGKLSATCEVFTLAEEKYNTRKVHTFPATVANVRVTCKLGELNL